MAPDLNSLPPSHPSPRSRTMHSSPTLPDRHDSNSRRGSTSLAAAATMNAADHSRRSSSGTRGRGSPHLDRGITDRRRSLVSSTLNLNDPAVPSPGEMAGAEHRTSLGSIFSATSPSNLGGRTTIATGDPHHQRQPSLGEIHNELEQEQEAQVNRMLQMIRLQQQQLEALQRQQGDGHASPTGDLNSDPHITSMNTAIADEATPASERSFSFQHRPHSMSRHPSSANRSPALRPFNSHDLTSNSHTASTEWLPPASPLDPSRRRNSIRDETAYYQAETANLTRENQMLKLRIRELEKQLADGTNTSSGTAVSTNVHTNTSSPSLHSNLATSTVIGGSSG